MAEGTMAIIRIRGAVPLTIQCPNCSSSIDVPPPTRIVNRTRSFSGMTCTCGQLIQVIVKE